VALRASYTVPHCLCFVHNFLGHFLYLTPGFVPILFNVGHRILSCDSSHRNWYYPSSSTKTVPQHFAYCHHLGLLSLHGSLFRGRLDLLGRGSEFRKVRIWPECFSLACDSMLFSLLSLPWLRSVAVLSAPIPSHSYLLPPSSFKLFLFGFPVEPDDGNILSFFKCTARFGGSAFFLRCLVPLPDRRLLGNIFSYRPPWRYVLNLSFPYAVKVSFPLLVFPVEFSPGIWPVSLAHFSSLDQFDNPPSFLDLLPFNPACFRLFLQLGK